MHQLRKLDLTSMYQSEKVLGGHMLSLKLNEFEFGRMAGQATFDPNMCSLDLWGDRAGCTKMGFRPREVQATMMRTFDEAGHKRVHWAMNVDGEPPEVRVALVEYPSAGLWYLSVRTEEGTRVVPLFDAALFERPVGG